MTSCIRYLFLPLLLALLAGCGEETYDASDSTSQMESFAKLVSTFEDQATRGEFTGMYSLYLKPYVDENGGVVQPDMDALDGLTATEVHAVLQEHADMMEVMGYETLDGGHGTGGSSQVASDPDVDIEIQGMNIYLTAIADSATINNIAVNRGNCEIHPDYKTVKEYRYLRMPDGALERTDMKHPVRKPVDPYPIKLKFGEQEKRLLKRRCNVREVSVTTQTGSWTWSFE